MNHIHPSAIIAPGARIAAGVTIGPFCTVGADVELREGVTLVSHVAIEGHTILHEGVQVSPYASVGLPPQDLKYKGEPTRCEIGPRSLLREHVTVHRGSLGRGLFGWLGFRRIPFRRFGRLRRIRGEEH